MILVGGNDGFISVENILNTSNDEFDTKVGVFDKQSRMLKSILVKKMLYNINSSKKLQKQGLVN